MAEYEGTGNEGEFGRVNNPAKESVTATEKNKLPIYMTRENPVYSARKLQMEINTLGVCGGRDYVKKRLSRYAGESRIDWQGGQRADGSKATGRKDQSHAFPYLKRIADKIDQHVFSELPKRDGIDEDFRDDASASGKSINEIMQRANQFITSCGWCWIGIDAPDIGNTQISVDQKKRLKIRPYWDVYSPLSVVDWSFNAIGELDWLITEGEEYESPTPESAQVNYTVRRIWERGTVRTIKTYTDKDGKIVIKSDEEQPLTYKQVPFVLVGRISGAGHMFDDIESINRSIMDLESVNRQNFFRASYPQLVLPESVIQNTADQFRTESTGAADMILGLNYPILISKDDPNPFYLMPDASALKAPREEIQSLKRNMFEAVGLMLQSESKQVASAESKAWDFLDVSQVMKSRANLLQEAEKKCAIMTNEIDPDIPLWDPQYNTDFDIGDFSEELNALIMTANAPMPVEMTRIVLEKILNRLDRLGSHISDKQRQEALDAIDAYNPMQLSFSGLPDLDGE